MIGKTINRYRVRGKIGEGGMGEVFLADDTELNRKVALKFLAIDDATDGDVRARFKREAQTAAALNHPNIITVYEVGQYEDRPFIAMEYIDGQPLSELVASGELTTSRVLELAEQIGEGLAHAHHAGVVHRDIKPDNVFLERNGRVKILDFGLAKGRGVSKLTSATSTYGTLYYMSPEQVRGEDVDTRSDVFSFGVLLYEMLTGKRPFEGDHSAAIIYSITNEDPKPLVLRDRKSAPDLDLIVRRAVAKRPQDRYATIDEMLVELRRYQAGLAPSARPNRKNLVRVLLPTSVVFVIVAALMFFNPFRVEITPDQQAAAAHNSLAIMYFENMTNSEDNQRLGEIVTNLLITDLSESEYMEVVSGQRLYDILKLQGKEGEKVIDRSTATDVASHAGAKWMLLGSILQEEPIFIVTSQLVDVKTGKVAASQRVTGDEGEKIFSVVDKLTNEIKQDLALPVASDADAPVAEVTTPSTDAYRYYLEGMDYLNKYYGNEARQSFDKALEYDSTFAMVYLRKSSSLVTASRAERRSAIASAMRYSDGVTKKERHYIASASALLAGDIPQAIAELEALIAEYPNEKDAYRDLGDIYRTRVGDVEKAVPYYRKAIEIDPMDKWSYNVLAYAYQNMGDIDNYIWAIYQYMALAPDEANPYDSRGDLYAYSGKIDKAIKSYDKALERKPDFYPSRSKLGHMYLFENDDETARQHYDALVTADDAATRAWGRTLLALVPLYRGQYDAALELLDEGIAADRADGASGPMHTQKYVFRARALAAKGEYEKAIAELERGMEIAVKNDPEEKSRWLSGLVELYARAGDNAGANGQLRQLAGAIQKTDPEQTRLYTVTEGLMKLNTADPDGAIVSFEAAGVTSPWFYFDFHLARAYLESGRLPEAVGMYEAMVRRFSEDRAYNPIEAVALYYYLGLAYELSGRAGKAIEQYTTLLDLWSDADPENPTLNDARERLARLNRS